MPLEVFLQKINSQDRPNIMNPKYILLISLFFVGGLFFAGCNSNSNNAQELQEENDTVIYNAPMQGSLRARTLFENPYANIPAQCYIETSYGTQNACLFCHSNAAARLSLGNTTPQAGLDPLLGNLQLEYAFGAADRFSRSPNINPWENTIKPELLEAAFDELDINALLWDMQSYIQTDNWQAAYDKKRGDKKISNSTIKADPFRLFPALNPKALPADSDGFVRTANSDESLFPDLLGNNTGWRAINFMPYGIFTPHTGSVSGVYIRLDSKFMKNENGDFDLEAYKANLELLEQAVQDRIEDNATHYKGFASDEELHRGLFPLKTEFAHPLHYVDVEADGTNSKFPGTRSLRVKEVRYMYKWKMHYTNEPISKDENAPLYYNDKETWIDNGAGWWMSAFIEDKDGELRAQTPEEMMQCVGCHSSRYGFEPEHFNSGTGNTIDTVWSFSRKFAGDLGWKEMDYLNYKQNPHATQNNTSGDAQRGDPINRDANIGEYRKFLNHVVGASLYGEMPNSMELYLQNEITEANGYSRDFPALEFNTTQELKSIQQNRLELMREYTGKKAYLTDEGFIQSALLYPTLTESLDSAKNYRKVVATQRYTKGKDYFGTTLFTYRYYRDTNETYTHIDGTPYSLGETITDRPYHTEETILRGVGMVPTLIDENSQNYDSEYLPIFKYPQEFESKH
jgi:nitrate reductase cytochrome c-type subunit